MHPVPGTDLTLHPLIAEWFARASAPTEPQARGLAGDPRRRATS